MVFQDQPTILQKGDTCEFDEAGTVCFRRNGIQIRRTDGDDKFFIGTNFNRDIFVSLTEAFAEAIGMNLRLVKSTPTIIQMVFE